MALLPAHLHEARAEKETVEDGRVDSARPGPRPSAPALQAVPNSAFLQNGHSCFKKSSRLAKRNNYAFPKCRATSGVVKKGYVAAAKEQVPEFEVFYNEIH